jgi:GNAT superfamily N-acetyltransferase
MRHADYRDKMVHAGVLPSTGRGLPGQGGDTMTGSGGRVRPIEASDVDAVVGLVHELAAYERAADQCHLTAAQLQAALFGDRPALFGHVAEVDRTVVGCSLWFLNFSTWRGVHGIYLEDLFVQPAHRGKGLGRALLGELAKACVRRGYARLEWAVLDWNEPSIRFYQSLGATAQDEWSNFRLDGEALVSLAQEPGV